MEWAEKQTAPISDFSGCPWDRAAAMNGTLYEFLLQSLGGHAVLIADTPGLEDQGFEVWRRIHGHIYSKAERRQDELYRVMHEIIKA